MFGNLLGNIIIKIKANLEDFMISSTAVIFLILSGIISFFVPIGLIVYIKTKKKGSIKAFFIGVLAFVVAAQVIEGEINYYFLIY